MLIFVLPFVVAGDDPKDDSMDIEDIKNVKPSIPFGAGFFGMVIAFSKWIAFFGFIIGISIIIGKGPVASAINNANMKAESQDGLMFIIKIWVLGAIAYLAGLYIFETYLF